MRVDQRLPQPARVDGPTLRSLAVFVACAAAIALASPAVAEPSDEIPGDGVFQVGAEIAPGLYHTNGPSNPYVPVFGEVIAESMCRWLTYGTPDANKDHVVGTDSSMGPMYANVPATVAAFETVNCQPWTRVS